MDERTPPQRGIAEVLREFAGLLADDHSTDDIIHSLANYCTELLPVDGVGILLRESSTGGLVVGTANTDMGQEVERLEVELGEGPCTTSMGTGQQVIEPDLTLAEERYPTFVPRALEAGVRSIHGLPLTVRVEQIGALNVIASDVLALSASQLRTAQVLADVAVAYVANRKALDSSTTLVRQLQDALDSRIVIEQAKGVLAERYSITVSEAFEALRRQARSGQVKVHILAADIISGRRTLEL